MLTMDPFTLKKGSIDCTLNRIFCLFIFKNINRGGIMEASSYVYRQGNVVIGLGWSGFINLLLYIAFAGMVVYSFVMFVKLANRGIKLLDYYLEKRNK